MTIIGVPDGHKIGTPVVTATIDVRFRGMVRQVAGNLDEDAFDRYVVSLTTGRFASGEIERFKGLDAVVRVTDRKRQPVDAKAAGRRTWAAVAPASGDYRVEVVRNLPYCDPPITYLLTLIAK